MVPLFKAFHSCVGFWHPHTLLMAFSFSFPHWPFLLTLLGWFLLSFLEMLESPVSALELSLLLRFHPLLPISCPLAAIFLSPVSTSPPSSELIFPAISVWLNKHFKLSVAHTELLISAPDLLLTCWAPFQPMAPPFIPPGPQPKIGAIFDTTTLLRRLAFTFLFCNLIQITC